MSQTTMDITFRKVVPQANVHRFYRVIVTRNLLGESLCVSQWGRIGSCGQRREKTYNNATDAQLAGAASVLERLKRGYTVAPGLSFVDKSIEQAVALDYPCTLRRGASAVRTQPRSSARRIHRTSAAQMALWPEEKMPQRRAEQPAQDVPPPRHKMTTDGGSLLCPNTDDLSAAPMPITRSQVSLAVLTSRATAQRIAATPAPVRPTLPNDLQSDAQRQARIECVLKASQRLATRSGASLKLTRAESSSLTPVGSLTAYQREMSIEHAAGVPRCGWTARRHRALS